MKTSKQPFCKSHGLSELLTADAQYAQRYAITVQSTENLTAGNLQLAYPAEYTSWRNRKKWAKDHVVPWDSHMESFFGFLKVMGPIPYPKWTLDRIDPHGGYVPENLRWASKATQSQNRTNSIPINVDGEALTITEVSRWTGKSYNAVRMGHKRHGPGYIASLLHETTKHLEENQPHYSSFQEALKWEFPEDKREQCEGLYRRRSTYKWTKPRFYLELVASEIKMQKALLRSAPTPDEKIEAKEFHEYLFPRLNQTKAFIDMLNKRTWMTALKSIKPSLWSVFEDYNNCPEPPDGDYDHYHCHPDTGLLPWEIPPKYESPLDPPSSPSKPWGICYQDLSLFLAYNPSI